VPQADPPQQEREARRAERDGAGRFSGSRDAGGRKQHRHQDGGGSVRRCEKKKDGERPVADKIHGDALAERSRHEHFRGRTMEPRVYEPSDGTRIVAHVVYGLHTVSILLGLMTGASIAGAFIFSWPSILAVILNYIFRGDAEGTYLESHFAWQIRTFWLAALWLVVTGLFGWALLFFGIGFFILIIGFLVLGVWIAYRIGYGWLRLGRHEALPL
jgi:putative membrane protein